MNKQRWISFDQWLHTIYDVHAMADETFSARCYRELQQNPLSKKWAWRVKWIDYFALKYFGDVDHCRTSMESEMNGSQLPLFYKERQR